MEEVSLGLSMKRLLLAIGLSLLVHAEAWAQGCYVLRDLMTGQPHYFASLNGQMIEVDQQTFASLVGSPGTTYSPPSTGRTLLNRVGRAMEVFAAGSARSRSGMIEVPDPPAGFGLSREPLIQPQQPMQMQFLPPIQPKQFMTMPTSQPYTYRSSLNPMDVNYVYDDYTVRQHKYYPAQSNGFHTGNHYLLVPNNRSAPVQSWYQNTLW